MMRSLFGFILCCLAVTLASGAPLTPPLGFQPNIVYVLCDDMDRALGRFNDAYSALGGLEGMEFTKREVVEGGATFNNAFVNTPICCPSRVEGITGRYFHNIRDRDGGCMHTVSAPNVFSNDSLFAQLQSAGYQTFVTGKVTNDQGGAYWGSHNSTWKSNGMTVISAPPDFNSYNPASYFNKFANGTQYIEKLDKTNPIYGTTYQTAQLGNRTLRFLEEEADPSKPMYLYIGPHAPHFDAEPAPWYSSEEMFGSLKAPETPNYNVSSPNKPGAIRQNPPLTDDVKCWEDKLMRDRWTSLLSVDDLVEAVIGKLSDMNVLNQTFFVFSSDHGYHLGQWSVPSSKMKPYETDIRVPLAIKGPTIVPGSSFDQIVANVDIAPTFLELAGIQTPPAVMDGKSFAHLLAPAAFPKQEVDARNAAWRDAFLNEYLVTFDLTFDHIPIWRNTSAEWHCSDHVPRGPSGNTPAHCELATGVGNGTCYYVDSAATGSFRSLRILNSTHNWMYAEYDHTYEWKSMESIEFFELYNVFADPFQMTNIIQHIDPSTRLALHDQVEAYYACAGSSCP